MKYGYCYMPVSFSSGLSCGYKSLTARLNAASYKTYNSMTITKNMDYALAPSQTVAAHFYLTDRAGNFASLGTYYDSY